MEQEFEMNPVILSVFVGKRSFYSHFKPISFFENFLHIQSCTFGASEIPIEERGEELVKRLLLLGQDEHIANTLKLHGVIKYVPNFSDLAVEVTCEYMKEREQYWINIHFIEETFFALDKKEAEKLVYAFVWMFKAIVAHFDIDGLVHRYAYKSPQYELFGNSLLVIKNSQIVDFPHLSFQEGELITPEYRMFNKVKYYDRFL